MSEIYAYLQARRADLVDISAGRLFWLKATVISAFCIGLSMSRALWIGPRSYPLAPVSSMLPAVADAVALALYALLPILRNTCTGIAGVDPAVIESARGMGMTPRQVLWQVQLPLAAPRPRWLIAAFLAIIAAFCLMDQTRWQPWVFQYSFLLAAVALYSGNSADVGGERRTLNIARLVVASTYIFSGLQKINLNFMENDFPWIVQPSSKCCQLRPVFFTASGR